MSTLLSENEYEHLLSKITDDRKRIFLDTYPKFVVTAQTAEAIGISDQTAYNWINNDSDFSLAFLALKKVITLKMVEEHEKNIHSIALDPNTKDQSRIFGSLVLLRALAPEKYREKTEHTISGEIKFVSHIPVAANEQPPTTGQPVIVVAPEIKQIAEPGKPT